MTIDRAQAGAFIGTLRPNGEHCYLASHTMTYFQALIGVVPDGVPAYEVFEEHRRMAQVLREIAYHLERTGP